MDPEPDVSNRAYGKACLGCRTKKRRCLPGSMSGGKCQLCEKDGDECVHAPKRKSRTIRPPVPALNLLHQFSLTDDEQPSREFAAPSARPSKRPRMSTAAELDSIQSGSGTANYDQDTTTPPIHGLHPSTSPNTVLGYNQPFPTIGSLIQPSPPTASYLDPQLQSQLSIQNYTSTISDLINEITQDLARAPPNELLLMTYFVWQAPQLMPVNEELFRRDMERNGPYFSPLLLLAIYAQASRHAISIEHGNTYADKATALLSLTTSQPPSIPTIQSLLILAGRDLALGNTAGAWLKSGTAFRMISFLGFEADAVLEDKEVPAERLEEVRMRRHLFWSAFAWDKFISLNLGRQPAFEIPHWSRDLSPSFMPKPLREKMWTPIFPDEHNGIPPYAPQPSLEEETFFGSCLLYIELHQIIQRLYVTGRVANTLEDFLFTDTMSSRLLQWRRRISPDILLDTAYMPSVCPPPHILTLNILYRSTWILLRRPLIRGSTLESNQARESCIAKSSEINLLFSLHKKTFGLRNITYLMAYMAYVSATIDVAEALSDDPVRCTPAVRRLELTLQVLTEAVKHTPGIQRSLHHLRQKLQGSRDRPNHASGTATPTTAHPSSAQFSAEQVATSLATQNTASAGAFATLSIGAGFDELFASLQPEYYGGLFFDEAEPSTQYLAIPDYSYTWTSEL